MSVTPKESGLRPLRMEILQQLFSVVKLDPRKQKMYPKQPHRWYVKKKEASEHMKNWVKQYVAANPRSKMLLKVKFSRPNIDKWLNQYPHGLPNQRAARKGEPVYISAFEATKAWEKLQNHKYASEIKSTLTKAFLLLGQTELETWTPDDLKDLRKPKVTRKVKGQSVTRDNPLYNANTGDIYPSAATNIRRAFDDLNLPQIHTAGLKDVDKGFTATRQDWYLQSDELKLILKNLPDVETLLFVVLEINTGSRPVAIAGDEYWLKVEDLKLTESPPYWQYFEGKNEASGQRWMIKEAWDLIKLYISDKGLKGTDRFLPKNQQHYSKIFKETGLKTGVELLAKEGAAAYVLRHTFATQSRDMNVSLEVIMKQGGWTEPSTLMKHYIAIPRGKSQHELLGTPYDKAKLSFGEWVKQFAPFWMQRYYELTGRVQPKIEVTA